MGDYARVGPLFRKAIDISRNNLELAALVQSERQQIAMSGAVRHFFDSYLEMALRASDHQGPAYEAWLSWKGMVAQHQKTTRAAMDDPKLCTKQSRRLTRFSGLGQRT
jgi:hypothetical protein